MEAVVTTLHGRSRGSVADGVCAFLGVPYAAPPQELADTMHSAWVSFATTGDPGWPRYDLSRRATMRFNTTSHVIDDPRAWERALWEGVR